MQYLVASSATFSRDANLKFPFILLVWSDAFLSLVAVCLGFTELNPYFQMLLENPVFFVSVKIIAAVFIAWLVPGKLLLPSILFMVFVLSWNLIQLAAAFV